MSSSGPTASPRTLLILGAGVEQAPAYHAARELGCRIVGADRDAGAPAAALADRFLPVSTTDVDGIARLLGPERIAGIVSPASDASQLALHALAARLGTPRPPSAEAALASSDKGRFRAVLRELGLPAYASHQSGSAADLLAAAERIGLPVVVKPADASGSRGLALVAVPGELPAAMARAQAASVSGRAIVERHVAGTHCSAEAFLRDGEVAFLAVTRRRLTAPPHLVTVAHHLPAGLAPEVEAAIADAVAAICARLGIAWGPANFDVVVDGSDTPWFVEMGARLGGNGMARVIEAAYGVDTMRAAVRCALGDDFSLAPRRAGAAILHILHSDIDGTLAAAGDVEAALALPAVRQAEILVEPGAEVRAYRRAADKLGYLLLAGDAGSDLDGPLALALRHLRMHVEEMPHATAQRLPI
jgi:biotin carboxylase